MDFISRRSRARYLMIIVSRRQRLRRSSAPLTPPDHMFPCRQGTWSTVSYKMSIIVSSLVSVVRRNTVLWLSNGCVRITRMREAVKVRIHTAHFVIPMDFVRKAMRLRKRFDNSTTHLTSKCVTFGGHGLYVLSYLGHHLRTTKRKCWQLYSTYIDILDKFAIVVLIHTYLGIVTHFPKWLFRPSEELRLYWQTDCVDGSLNV
ncbi:hypothetical protein GGS24DRAFT_253260 [Hypoxylon argillaceum]|nr:hypothetical protein GGS24DRAFT_253260 [Hypoxylon argillaceum]